jgi:hypothetical protein
MRHRTFNGKSLWVFHGIAVFPYGYMGNEWRLPKRVLEWRPSGKRKRGRPKLTWAEGIRGMIAEKGLQEEDWTDRNNWKRKIA